VKVLYALLLSSLFLLPNSAMAEDRTYTFAVVPQQAVTELAKNWIPFLALLSERSGVRLKFVTAPDIPTFEKRLGLGAYDIAYMSPYHYTVFHKLSGYKAFAKEKGRKLTGILVARKDSPLANIKDLNGLTLVFPSPGAFAASILPRAALRKEGIVFKTKFVASHESVYLDVAQGLYPAGGGILRTLELMDSATKNELHVIWTTPGYTPHAIACHPRLPSNIEKKLQEAMLSLNGDPAGQVALKAIGFKGIELAQDRDWNDVRQLKITELDGKSE
jgi:phosphonate transport system substrate-binding protein